MGMSSVRSGETLISSLVVLKESDTFRTPMQAVMQQQKETDSKQVKSAHRADIEVLFDDVVARANASDKLIKKQPTNRNLVDNLIFNLMTGVNNPPRRLEWGSLKVRNYDETKENFLQGDTAVFNQYKTFKKYGQQRVQIDPKTMKTVRKLMKQSESDYLLTTVTGKPMSGSQLSHRLGTVFDNAKIGIDVLRSVNISHTYRGMPALNAANNLAEQMSHSFQASQLFYRKID
jgi:hypothetical protein